MDITKRNGAATVSAAPQKEIRQEEPMDYTARVELNMKLVYFRIHEANGVTLNNRDDVEQAGMVALCEAALGFDPTRGVKFSTYATVSIDRAIYREIEKSYNHGTVSYQNVLDLESSLTVEGVLASDSRIASPEYLYEQKVAETALQNLIPLYSEEHRPALVAMQMRVYGFKKKEIVEATGITDKGYRGKIHRTSKKLRKDKGFMVYIEGIGYKCKSSA